MFEMETGVVTGWPLSQVIAAHLRARRAHLSPTPEKFDPGYLLVRILTVLCHPPPYYRSVFADELTSSASSFHQPSCLKIPPLFGLYGAIRLAAAQGRRSFNHKDFLTRHVITHHLQ